jgi:hypothetical protein
MNKATDKVIQKHDPEKCEGFCLICEYVCRCACHVTGPRSPSCRDCASRHGGEG